MKRSGVIEQAVQGSLRQAATIEVATPPAAECALDPQRPPATVAIGTSIPHTAPPEPSRPDQSSGDQASTDEVPASASQVPVGTHIGQYEVIRPLGHGGMGAVYLARDLRLGRLVAVKFLSVRSDRVDAIFLAEARATARCQHEHIVVIHDVGEHAGRPYMVLEFLRGQTLAQWHLDNTGVLPSDEYSHVPQRTPLPAVRAAELLVPVVRALVHAHDMGVVHRDLKPANIVLTDSGTTKVLDFGVAKLLERAQADVDTIGDVIPSQGGVADSKLAGTPAYMAPEQLNCEPIDQRTDLWAVGIMLFELVMGTHPMPSLDSTDLFEIADLDTPMPSVAEMQPQIGTLGGIIDRCLLKDKDLRTGSARELLAELAALAPGGRATARGVAGNPFTGLSAFQERDANRFFGRDQDIATVTTRLRGQPVVAIAGLSGTGKSSIVRAGVIPALKRSGEGWDVHVIRPGRQPLAGLFSVLVHSGSSLTDNRLAVTKPERPGALRMRLRDEPGLVGAELRARALRKRRRVLVFVDQFEELFTMDIPQWEAQTFIACLDTISDDASSPLRLILSIRSDFLHRVAEYRAFMTKLGEGLLFLPPLTRAGMREILERPVACAGYQFDDGIVEDMLDHVAPAPVEARSAAASTADGPRSAIGDTSCPLPLLQFTGARLWDLRDTANKLITRASYRSLGGVAGALSMHADAVVDSMSVRDQRLARALLVRLVTAERTRAIEEMHELCDLVDGEYERSEAVLQRLAAARLLVIEERSGSSATVELVHESLIERWATLHRWLDDNAEDAEFRERLRTAAAQWESGQRADGLLWTGDAAVAAERRLSEYRARGDALLTGRDQRFLAAVVARAQRKRAHRRRLVVGAFVGLTLIAVVLAYFVVQSREQARRAQQRADEVRRKKEELQLEARRSRNATRMARASEMQRDPTMALALVREMETEIAPPAAWATLARRALDVGVAQNLFAHDAAVSSASFSPDGTRVVTSARDGLVRIFTLNSTEPPTVLRGHDGAVLAAAFSPDGTHIASAGADGTARVVRVDGAGEAAILRGHTGVVRALAFSPDGSQLVTGSEDRTARVFLLSDGRSVAVLRGHRDIIRDVAFDPTGTWVITAGRDDRALVWDLASPHTPTLKLAHGRMVVGTEFSPDGAYMISASEDRTANLWRRDGTRERVLRHRYPVWAASFSPDQRFVATAADDHVVRVWRADGTGRPTTFVGHSDTITSVQFDTSGRYVLSASKDGSARVWQIHDPDRPVIVPAHPAPVYALAMSADGQYLASGGGDHSVRVFRLADVGRQDSDFRPGESEPHRHGRDELTEVAVLRGHTSNLLAVAFSPDGERIMTGSDDHSARIWTRDDSTEPLVLDEFAAWARTVAFSPDGQYLAVAAGENGLWIWRADNPEQGRLMDDHHGFMMDMAFSPDSQRVVGAGLDLTVWSVATGQQVLSVQDQGDYLYSVAYSPDGQLIATGADDKRVRVWRADGSGDSVVLRGHGGTVNAVAFSPDSALVVSASDDKTVRVWHADGGGEPLVLHGHEERVMAALFSRDGRAIFSASLDQTVRIWRNLRPLTLDAPRLWTATQHCPAPEVRQRLLDQPPERASANWRACVQRVRLNRE